MSRDVIVSILRIITIVQINFDGDISFTLTYTDVWSVCEPGIAILVGCGPVLRPLLESFLKSRLISWSRGLSSSYARKQTGDSYHRMEVDQIELTENNKSPPQIASDPMQSFTTVEETR